MLMEGREQRLTNWELRWTTRQQLPGGACLPQAAASMARMQSTTLAPLAMAFCSASYSAGYRRSSVAAW